MGSEERGGGGRPAAEGGTRGAAGGRAKTEVGTGVGMPRLEEEVVVVVVDAPRGPVPAEAVTPLAAIAAASGPLVPPLPAAVTSATVAASVTADNVPLLLEFCIAPAPD